MPSASADDEAPQNVAPATQTGFRGVAVTATNNDNVSSIGIAASIGGEAGVGVGGTVNVITVDTNATVGQHATVNSDTTSRNSGQSVLVASGNQFHLLLAAASIAIGGGAGVGAGVNVAVLSIHATSLVDDYANVQAAKDVVVSATQQESLVAVTLAAGGGTVGVAGAVGVIVLGTQAWAKTGSHVTITAGNNAAFLARDDTKITGITGGAAGGFVGVGVGVYVLDLTKDTESTIASTSSVTGNAGTTDALAGISDGTVDLATGFGFAPFRGVAVQAQSGENIFGLVISIGGGFVGVAVPVGVTLLHVTTAATVAGTVSSGRDVSISALDDMKTITISGGVGGGFVGDGAGVDIGVADNSTSAVLASTGVITTARDVALNALSRKNVTTYTFAVGGGAVGVAGAVSIWSLGTEPTSSYSDGQGDNGNARNEGGSSPWQSGHNYSKGDHASVGGQDYVAKVDDPNESASPNTNSSQWDVGSSDDPATSADQQASDSSGNGYTTILNGSTTSSTAWASGTNYASGAEVTYGGETYVATVSRPNESESPDTNPSQWRDGSTDSHFSGMIGSHTSSTSSTIVSNKPSGSLTQDALSTTINPGTSAQLIGQVTATGDVTVNGHDALSFGGIVGSAAGGAVGVGASLLVGSVDAQTTAEVGGQITSGGEVYVHADLDEDTSTLAFAGAGGAIGVAAQVSVLLDSSTQTAEIDGGAKIHKALNGIDVKAENGRSVSALTIGGAIGGVAAGVAIGYVGLSGGTTASVGNATIGDTGTVTSLTVEAHDASHATTEAIAVGAGIGVGLAGAVALSHVSPTTSATLSGSAAISTTGAVDVTADSMPRADSDAIGVGVGGAAGLGVSVADSEANGNVTASIGDEANYSVGSVSVDASRLAPATSGVYNTDAESTAGGGGILFGASGAIANASSTATVTASVGKDFHLPNGDFSVQANGGSAQRANASGLSIGLVGIGATVATASTTITTKATIDTGLTSSSARQGDWTHGVDGGSFALQSNGNNVTVAISTAGSGGVVSGNAAEAHTSDSSTSSTTLGATTHTIYSGDFTDYAVNTATYYSASDSTSAGVVDASGAFSQFAGNTSAGVTLPSNLTITSSGVVNVQSENDVAEAQGGSVQAPSDNVKAAGGGGLSLTAAQSSATITGHSTVTIGTNFHVSAFNQPESPYASIAINASSTLFAGDTIDLETGGAINGAGVDEELTGHLYTTITLDTGANLQSSQDVGIGTWTIVDGTLEADESTWGLAAVGFAEAHLSVDTHETITVGGGAYFLGMGDVNIRAGDQTGDHDQTSLNGTANAEGYIRGLIAVPDASASAHITSDQEVNLGTSGSHITVISGRNTTIGSDPHDPHASADGTGHGYELGFIPVTDGSSDPQASSTANVTLYGSVEAGYYATLTITIGTSQDEPNGFTGAVASDVVQNTQSVPVSWYYDGSFSPVDFLNGSPLDPQDLAILLQNVQSGTVGAIHLGNVWAAAGNIVVDAKNASGSATFTAHGGPSITITNNSRDYLVFDGTTDIPWSTGGRIVFDGGANAFGTRNALNTDVGGTITIHNSSTAAYFGVGAGASSVKTGAGIAIGGEVSNLGGHVEIDDDGGSVLAIAPIYADSISISAPNGALFENEPGQTTVLGSAPMSEFNQFVIFPGGNPYTGATTIHDLNANADTVVAYVASYLNQINPGSDTAFTQYLVGSGSDAGWNPNTGGGDISTIYFGDCVPAWSGNCDSSYNAGLSPDGSAYQYAGGDVTSYYPVVPYEGIIITAPNYGSESTTNAPFGGTATDGITAGTAVIIHAAVIDANTHITVGAPTNWSAKIPANLTVNAYVNGILTAVTLAQYRSLWLQHRISSATIGIPVALVGAGDSPMTATYDASTDSITVGSVQAGSGSGIVELNGNIANTNNLGLITVNGGLGQIQIDNETTSTLIANDLYAGSIPDSTKAATSMIDIVDTTPQKNLQTLYTYRPGVGVKTFTGPTSYSMDQMQSFGTLVSTSSSTSGQYDPTAGLRLEWQLQATLSRTVDTDKNSQASTLWAFNPSSDNSDNPWEYLNYTDGQFESADNPSAGYVVDTNNHSIFSESVTGAVTGTWTQNICYDGYDLNNNGKAGDTSWCPGDGIDPGDDVSYRSFTFVTSVTITLKMSVKADNPINWEFAGGSRGLVSIISKGNVILDGDITNGSGDTIVNATGSITQATTASIATDTLQLDAGGGVGTSGSPINATITNGGTLGGASGSAGFWLTLASGAAITSIDSGSTGDVQIVAGGALTRGAFSSGKNFNVSGRNITLTFIGSSGVETTDAGGIGTLASPLVISAHTTHLANGGFSGGIVTVHAPDTVALKQVGGRPRRQPAHLGQRRRPAEANGSIYDLRGQTPAQVIADDEDRAVGPPAPAGRRPPAADDHAYENLVNRNYFPYWSCSTRASARSPEARTS